MLRIVKIINKVGLSFLIASIILLIATWVYSSFLGDNSLKQIRLSENVATFLYIIIFLTISWAVVFRVLILMIEMNILSIFKPYSDPNSNSMKTEIFDEQIKKLESCIEKYQKTLSEKRQSLVTTDDYGDLTYKEWIQEITSFVKEKVTPKLPSLEIDDKSIAHTKEIIKIIDYMAYSYNTSDDQKPLMHIDEIRLEENINSSYKNKENSRHSWQNTFPHVKSINILYLATFLTVLSLFMPMIQMPFGNSYNFFSVDPYTHGVITLLLVSAILLFTYLNNPKPVLFLSISCFVFSVIVHLNLSEYMNSRANSVYMNAISSELLSSSADTLKRLASSYEYSWGWFFLYASNIILIISSFLNKKEFNNSKIHNNALTTQESQTISSEIRGNEINEHKYTDPKDNPWN